MVKLSTVNKKKKNELKKRLCSKLMGSFLNGAHTEKLENIKLKV